MKKMIVLLTVFLLVGCAQSKEIIETKYIENTEIIVEEDSELLVGEEKIVQESKPQEIQQLIKVSYDFFNRETGREIVNEKIIFEGQATIKKIGTKEVKIVEETEYDEEIEVLVEEDPSIEYYQEVVAEEGILGKYLVEYEETYVKDELVGRKELSRKVLVEAKPTIILTNTTIPDVVENNEDLSWWYIPGSPKASISSDVANLISQHNVLWQIPTEEKVVYLTFDEGYEYGNNTKSILETLKTKNVKATFFVTGSYVDHNMGLVNQMMEEGHQVANHTINHYRAAPTIDEDVNKYISDVVDLENKVNGMVRLHRPPEGGYSAQSLSILDGLGYKTVFWSFAYRDWLTDDQPDLDYAHNFIINNIHPGSILLLHAVSTTNTMILGDVIDDIRAMGYRIDQLQP